MRQGGARIGGSAAGKRSRHASADSARGHSCAVETKTGHSHTSDGTIVAGGGDWANGGFLLEGRYAVRTWAKDGNAWAVRPEGLAYPHCESSVGVLCCAATRIKSIPACAVLLLADQTEAQLGW